MRRADDLIFDGGMVGGGGDTGGVCNGTGWVGIIHLNKFFHILAFLCLSNYIESHRNKFSAYTNFLCVSNRSPIQFSAPHRSYVYLFISHHSAINFSTPQYSYVRHVLLYVIAAHIASPCLFGSYNAVKFYTIYRSYVLCKIIILKISAYFFNMGCCESFHILQHSYVI